MIQLAAFPRHGAIVVVVVHPPEDMGLNDVLVGEGYSVEEEAGQITVIPCNGEKATSKTLCHCSFLEKQWWIRAQ